MLQVRNRTELGGGDHGWLKAKHHFAVTADGNPAHHPLGALVVWNDDEIAPGTGFGLHAHQNMEIITYVREGAVTHEDSNGLGGRIEAGNVQVMSTGTGIRHSEKNNDDVPLRIFQIWLKPRRPGGVPTWEARAFPKEGRAGRLVALASGFGNDASALPIRADARVLGATLPAGGGVTHQIGQDRYAYLALARGTVLVNGFRLLAGDGIAATNEVALGITAEVDAELILVDTA